MEPTSSNFTYTFDIENGKHVTFLIKLDDETLECLNEPPRDLPKWTRLEYQQCESCPLNKEEHPYCPVAVNLHEVFEQFQEVYSFQRAEITIKSPNRTYFKESDVQQGLSSLLGILMATSGCPKMDKLRPMVRTHLPFSSMRETLFRVVSMYIMSQYFRKRRGLPTEDDLNGLLSIYQEVEKVNTGMSARMREFYKTDANINALVILTCLGQHAQLTLEDELYEELESLFSAYFE
ncbi:MAG: hypothetical protein JJU41_10995 [Bacteroidetes bacterium]|nr:hypothetical protein [Bacteroidota bacterium]MCH8524494.1 hypothetical protein [Balneolales bacterium]